MNFPHFYLNFSISNALTQFLNQFLDDEFCNTNLVSTDSDQQHQTSQPITDVHANEAVATAANQFAIPHPKSVIDQWNVGAENSMPILSRH